VVRLVAAREQAQAEGVRALLEGQRGQERGAFRQALEVGHQRQGVLNPALNTDASRAWGFTHNTDITWRSGLGISQDGRYLIYAVGNGTNARFLAEALQEAGAYNAMQLDINQYYDQFDAYMQANGQPAAQRLLDQMTYSPDKYLKPEVRDFFYVTTR
jgi:hypothetical protein